MWRTHEVISVDDVDSLGVDSDVDRIIDVDRQQSMAWMLHLATEERTAEHTTTTRRHSLTLCRLFIYLTNSHELLMLTYTLDACLTVRS